MAAGLSLPGKLMAEVGFKPRTSSAIAQLLIHYTASESIGANSVLCLQKRQITEYGLLLP